MKEEDAEHEQGNETLEKKQEIEYDEEIWKRR